MIYVDKNGNIYNDVITDNDVIVTSSNQMGKNLKEILDEQQTDINKLKSNMKHIFLNGGVGGNGSGGSGTGTGTAEPILNILLNDNSVVNGGSAILLDNPGDYDLYFKVRNSAGKNYQVTYYIDNDTRGKTVSLKADERCEKTERVTLRTNGELRVRFYNDDWDILGTDVKQSYIVSPHTFDVQFLYKTVTGESRPFANNEHYIGSSSELDPYIDISYDINIADVDDITVTATIGDTDLRNDIHEFGTEKKGHLCINLSDVMKNGETFLQPENTGSYNVEVVLKYKKNNNLKEDRKTFNILLLPSDLFVNITSDRDILYSSETLLRNDMIEGIPVRNVNQGTYVNFYGYVYEGAIQGGRKIYPIAFKVKEYLEVSENTYDWVENDVLKSTYTVTEQTKDNTGFTVSFTSPGLKKIELTTSSMKGGTTGESRTFEKYIFVKEYVSQVDWTSEYMSKFGGTINYDAYFRTNQEEVYSDSNICPFPVLPSGNMSYVLRRIDTPYTIDSRGAWTNQTGNFSTILSFGIQYSNVNVEDAKILDIYFKNSVYPDFTLYSTHLFSDVTSGDNKIQIPVEQTYNTSHANKYHLIQIIREYKGNNVYVDYLYIDGLIESSNWTQSNTPMMVSKIILNNVNIAYNLINVQYIGENNDHKFNSDAAAYVYNLTYKEKISNPGTLTSEEIYFLNHVDEITFDGTDVILTEGLATNIAEHVSIPSLMIEHTLLPGEDVNSVMANLFVGRSASSSSYGDRPMSLYWCSGRENSTFEKIDVHEIQGFIGEWNYTLQGTSTMSNKIKNFSLKYKTTSSPLNAGINDNIVVSPNFIPVEENERRATTFLPEQEWTLKADIADSAHANNTCMGKFVNEVTTPFVLPITIQSPAKKYIRNTLEGFPVLMFFKCDTRVYYFGIYNFNMGRTSYFNLGYNTHIDELYENCTTSGRYAMSSTFLFTIADCTRSDICVGEIQENSPEFDFHQFDSSVLFKDGANDDYIRMFGDRKDIVCHDYESAKTTLLNLVRDIAMAGKYCYDVLGKEQVSSREDYETVDVTSSSAESVNRYTTVNHVPSINEQMRYTSNGRRWSSNNQQATVMDLEKLLLTDVGGNVNSPRLDYTSASEYFTLCMGFGLVDSVVKNMNIKSWDGTKCYTAFYDMDCALGEENSGKEIVVYNAGTDYWFSEVNELTRKVDPIKIYYDYWNNELGKGFDYPSSYLFAVVKYAKSIFDSNIELGHCPQEFWAELRMPQKDESRTYTGNQRSYGELCNVDYFIDKYFKSGVRMIPEYLASLNYKVKYLYTDNSNPSNPVYIANHEKFNGSRTEKVKVWLTKRIQFMDVMMNVMGINKLIVNEVTGLPTDLAIPIPQSNIMEQVQMNPDVSIAQCAFTTTDLKAANSSMNTDVFIYAAPNTPFILNKAEEYEVYMLPSPLTDANKIHLNWEQSKNVRFFGSKSFVDIDKIEAFFTRANKIESDSLENITYSGLRILDMTSGLTITSTSVKNIKLDIPNLYGKLIIDNGSGSERPYGQSLEYINISGSRLYGDFTNLENLKGIDMSSVNAAEGSGSMSISGCKMFSGDNCNFSGISPEKKTKLATLQITDAEGLFVFNNTDIQEISITSKMQDNEYETLSTFEINNDNKLKSLDLRGFRRVIIRGCNNLERLYIDKNGLEELTIDMFNSFENNNTSKLKYIEGTLLDAESDQSSVISVNGAITMTGYTDKSFIPQVSIVDGMPVEDAEGSYEYYDDKKIDSTIVPGIYNLRGCSSLRSLTITNCDNVRIIKLPNAGVEVGSMAHNHIMKYVDTNDNLNRGSGHYPNSAVIITRDGTFRGCPNYSMKTSMVDSQSPVEYTTIRISNECTTLADTWNTDGQTGADDTFNSAVAYNFMQYIVGHESQITSLSGLFMGRTKVNDSDNNLGPTSGIDRYNLQNFTSLNDISRMFYDTGISFISSKLLNLPANQNDSEHILNWDDFLKGTTYRIANDALKNVSYRLNNISNKTYVIHKWSTNRWVTEIEDPGEEYYDIINFFCPKIDEETGEYIPFTNIHDLSNINFSENQKLDFSRMLELFPNVKVLAGFMNKNLSNFKIDGMLSSCKNMVSITESFTDSHNTAIDLWEFFNWEDNDTIEHLFEGRSGEGDAFTINKRVSYENFTKILTIISGGVWDGESEDITYDGYQHLSYLTNIFRNCVIINYEGQPITFPTIMENIINVSHLFDGCVSDCLDRTLNFRHSFFEKLPNVTRVIGTFKNVNFDHMLDFDFFNKRNTTPTATAVKVIDGNDDEIDATLYEYQYRQDIFKMSECFSGCKFYGEGCAWFNDELTIGNIPENYVEDSMGNRYTEYKDIRTGNTYQVHTYEKEDFYHNFSNYIETISCKAKDSDAIEVSWCNHPIESDLSLFNNGEDIYESESLCRIFSTYCCLPTDLLYGCNSMVTLDSAFSNTNIIGVIPRHFTRNCGNATMSNIFKNVNILPNVQFFYNKYNSDYHTLIDDIPAVDETYDTDSWVLFMDEDGNFKRRVAAARETSIGQFVYVPDGFIKNNNINNVFNFRYNLPENMTVLGRYQNTTELDNAVRLYKEGSSNSNPFDSVHMTQYFFTTDNSCDWRNLINATKPFISEIEDVSFRNGKARVYYEDNADIPVQNKYMWVATGSNEHLSTGWTSWNKYTKGVFNVFLNLCGRRTESGELVDNGCPVNLNKGVKLSLFLNGTLTTFLNGLIFSSDVLVQDMTAANISGGNIITFADNVHFSKNIILPSFTSDLTYRQLPLMESNSDYHYYSFMINDDTYYRMNKWPDGTRRGFNVQFVAGNTYKYDGQN